MKIAILHEMLVKFGGAEKVVQTFIKMYPEADIFTLIYDNKKMNNFFPDKKIITAKKTQKIYNLFKNQRLCLPFMAQAVESLDFSKYDMVICSSSAFAHGAITKPECKFIVYYHAPARYLWDWTNEYKKEIGAHRGLKGYVINKLFLKLRIWDYIASKRSDISFANSKITAGRIMKYHRKKSIVLYPPIETRRFQKIEPHPNPLLLGEGIEQNNYYIIISALTEFKRLDVAINGFNNLEQKLLIIGAGEYKRELEKLIAPPLNSLSLKEGREQKNIIFTGPQYGDDLVSLVQNSLGLIFPGEEDFGIVPIEAMAAGKSVFALAKGGLLETVIPGMTGEFFSDVEGKDFVEKFNIYHNNNILGKYKSEDCINQAQKFSEENFIKKFKEEIGK